MKILLSWLSDYVDSGDDLDALVGHAHHARPRRRRRRARSAAVDGVVTARVVRTEAPPERGQGAAGLGRHGRRRERHVWCGAFNFAAGDIVPLAPVGTTMPDGRTISRRGILGIDSEGMLCSARELGLGDDHSGILVLPADAPLGVPYGDALGLRSRRRARHRRHPQPARLLGVRRRGPRPRRQVGSGVHAAARRRRWTARATSGSPAVEIVDGDRCGRFTSTVLSGVRVGPSAGVDGASG